MQHVTDHLVEPRPSHATRESLSAATIVDLAIAGMGCLNCANSIRNALLAQRGVVEAELDATTALARVWYDSSFTCVAEILGTVAALGERTQHRFLAVPLRSDAARDDDGEHDADMKTSSRAIHGRFTP